MIAKISTGSGFRGALDYIFKEDAVVIGGNMAGDDPRALSKEFGITRALREDIKKPCYHISLTLPRGETLDSKQWERIAGKYLSRMGIDPLEHQYILVQHKDTEFNHIHILTSRIALNGGVWKPEYDKMKSKDICRQLEKEHGLTAISNEKRQYRAQTTQKERRMAARTGREPEKVFVQKKMNEILTEGASLHPQAFCSELEKHGIIAIPNVSKTGKMNGFAFQYAGRSYTGSQVGYSWKNLKKFIEIAPEDTYWMQERKNRLQEGTPADAVRSIRNAVWETGILGVPFSAALEKQGWTISGDRITKGETAYDLAAIVDPETLRANLRTLEAVGKQAKEQARKKSRELARKYYATKPRKSFLAEMKTEDVLCGMVLFPEVVIFLLVLSVLTESIRQMDRPKNQEEFAARMNEIWQGANTEVQNAVKKVKEEIRNARLARSNQTDISVTEKAGRGLREENGSRRPSVREVGTETHIAAFRGSGRDRGNEGGPERAALETKNPDSNGLTWISGGNSSSPVELISARGQQSDVQATPDSGAIAEWASLAQDLSILSQGRSSGVNKKTSGTAAYIEQMWERQHSALQAPHYRLTLRWRGPAVDPLTGKANPVSINLGKIRDGAPAPAVDPELGALTTREDGGQEILWTAEGVKAKISELAHYNARGFDVYLTPIDDSFHHLLFDDLTPQGVEYVKKNYSPCEIHSSSEGNFQAIIKIPKKEVSPEEQSSANELLRKLNHLPAGCGGDKSISAARHPFRMVGFKNKKSGRNGFQSKIELVRPGTVCERATAELESIREARRAQDQSQERVRRVQAIETAGDTRTPRPEGETMTDQVFRWEWKKVYGLALKKTDEKIWTGPDLSVIDYRVCQEMLIRGYSEELVAEALERCSPSLCDRHSSDPRGYALRTVAAAAASLEEVPVREERTGGVPFDDGR